MNRLSQTWHWLTHPTKLLERGHAQRGDRFTLRTLSDGDRVFLADPPAIQSVFLADGEQGPSENRELFSPLLGSRSLLVAEGAEHERARRSIAAALHPRRFAGYGPRIRDLVDEEVDTWPLGAPFKLIDPLLGLVLRALLAVILQPRARARRDQLAALIIAGERAVQNPLLHAPPWLRGALGRFGPWGRTLALRARFNEQVDREVCERRTQGGGEDDVLSVLLAEQAAPDEIRDQVFTLLVAGHDTTAVTLSWTLHFLAQDPARWETLAAQVRRVESDPAAGRVLDIPLLDATLRESLRLQPVIPFVKRTLARPLLLGVHELPAGTVVAPCMYLAHRDPQRYPAPQRFLPERFLQRRPTPTEWFPFGGGQHRCVGSSLALYLMKLILATVLTRTTLQPVPGPAVRPVRRFFTLAPSDGVPVILVARAPRTAPCPTAF